MRDQWTELIYKPLSRLKGGSQSPLIIVFVFDALDECGPQDDIRKLIQLLAETKHLVAVQFRALVTSRPEIPIQLGFRAISGKLHEDFVLHNIAPPVVQHDIEIFLRHEIKVIRDDTCFRLIGQLRKSLIFLLKDAVVCSSMLLLYVDLFMIRSGFR